MTRKETKNILKEIEFGQEDGREPQVVQYHMTIKDTIKVDKIDLS